MRFDIKDPYVFDKKIISGAPIFINNLPWSPCINITIGFRIGAMNDPVGKEGLSHFLEHSVMNGSSLYPTPKEVHKFRKKFTLDTLNAGTAHHFTNYVGKCLPEHFEEVFRGIWSLATDAVLDPVEIERERPVILQESWGRYKNAKKISYTKQTLHTLFHGTNIERVSSPLGWPDTIEKISIDDVKNWYKQHYHAGNMFILLVGCIEDKHVKLVEGLLEKLPKQPASFEDVHLIDIPRPLIQEQTFLSEETGMKQDNASLSIISNKRYDDIEPFEVAICAEDVLRTLFHEKLREEMTLCYSTHVRMGKQFDYISNSIGVDTSPDKVKSAQEAIFEIIERFKTDEYKEKFEQERQIILDQLRSAERTTQRITDNSQSMLITDGEIKPLTVTIENLSKVDFRQVADYTLKVFKKEEVYIEIILP